MDLLQEQFLNFQLKTALSAVGLKSMKVGNVGDSPIYTDSSTKDIFIEEIQSQDTLKPIINDITRLIESDRIIPVVVKTGILNKIKFFFFKNKRKFAESQYTMAFFDIESQKIFILGENIKNLSYWKKQEALSLTLLHELQHMTSALFPNSFLSIHKQALNVYYKTFFKLFFTVDIDDNETQKLVNWLHFKTETLQGRATLTEETSKEYFNLLWSILTPKFKNRDSQKKIVIKFFNSLGMYVSKPELYVQMVASKTPPVFQIYSDLRNSYKSLKVMNIDSLCIQELLHPSEVICIESEYNTKPRHFALISKIK